MNFPKVVLVIILLNVMSGKRFICWVMGQKAIDQSDCMNFQSVFLFNHLAVWIFFRLMV